MLGKVRSFKLTHHDGPTEFASLGNGLVGGGAHHNHGREGCCGHQDLVHTLYCIAGSSGAIAAGWLKVARFILGVTG
jgi:hypothetical protein